MPVLEQKDTKPGMNEHIKKHPIWYIVGWIALLCVLLWLFQSWPGGFWSWPGMAWGWLRKTPGGYESGSTTVRNLGLILAGLIALPLTLWRIRVADSQAKAAHQQVESSQDQVVTSQRSLLNERYQKGAEMLGSEVLSVRLGGIFALARLARERPGEYHVQIMRLFCAFVQNPTFEDSEDVGSSNRHIHRGPQKIRPDVQEIMTAIGKRSDSQIQIELQEEYKLDLHEVNLNHAELVEANLFYANLQKASLFDSKLIMANLSRAWMPETDLSKAELIRADLSGTSLIKAKLHSANLHGAKLYGVNFSRADLSGAILFSARGLTQKQLDSACADPDSPPDLESTLDTETGEQLVWRGKPFNE